MLLVRTYMTCACVASVHHATGTLGLGLGVASVHHATGTLGLGLGVASVHHATGTLGLGLGVALVHHAAGTSVCSLSHSGKRGSPPHQAVH